MEKDCDIAIIGIGCRFPGADNIDEFWRVLVNGENHVIEIPTERWNTDAFYDEDKDVAGKIYVRKAGLIKDYDKFDPRPFGISDTEAERMGPQQRYVLECVHMAFEDGGITRKTVNGSRTGVYIGVMNDDYKGLFFGHHVYDTPYSATGFSSTIIAARVSYVYNLQGPCLALDTACSSGMVAVHLGSQALLAGDCEMAICGGVNSIISPETFIPLCRAKMMSATGQCQTFCDSADGYARGEGCGIVVLKKLSQAVKDGNKIWGIVKTGSNQDGRAAQPITSPSPEQQYKLLDTLYTTCGINPSSIQYVEMHGTGTPVGDPIETNTLGRFFYQARSIDFNKRIPLLIGSVKTNIGHTESAAGVAGLIKVVLMMRYGKVVPSLHIKVDKSNLNPAIRLNEYNLDIPVAVRDWERNEDGDRIACVSSYGFGGSNGHAILIQKQTFDCEQEKVEEAATKSFCYVALSSASSEGLEQTLDRFKKQIMHRAEINLESISYTSTCHRDHFPYRICFAVNSVKELAEQVATKLPEQKRQTLPLNLVFVYCGVGTTWTGMCSQLIKIDAGFRAGVLEVDKYLKPLSGISMENLFSQSTTDYGDPFVNHIAIFTTQVGLTFMWRKLGIKPNVVVGQSVGEVAAAYASESIDLGTAVDVIYHRSKILASHQGGSMMVVKGVHIEVVEKYCERYEKRVSVAVYSSPIACTLSGETIEMKKLKTDILEYSKRQNTNIFIKELDVRCAYHSHMVEQCMHEIRQNLKPAVKIPRTIPVISTVTGRQAEADDLQSVDYWAQNIRKPVLMNEAIMNSLKEKQNNIILEIGPKPVLRAHIEDIVQAGTVECLSSMTYSKELSTRSATVVKLYENGVDIEWKNEVRMSRLCSLPAYAFDRRTLLLIPEEEKRKYQGLQVASVVDHMFLRNSLTQGKEFYIVIGKATTPFVFDHFMGGTLLVPGSTYLDAVFAIAARKLRLALVDISVSVELEHMHTPLAERDDQIECEVNVARDEVTVTFAKGNRIFSIGKARKGDFLLPKTVPVSQLIDSYNNVFLKADVYTALEDLGFMHGSSLRIIERVWYSNTDCLAEIHVTDNVVEEFNSTHIHPAVVDSMFQVCGVFARGTDSGDDIIVPKGVRATRVHGYLQQRMFCFAAKSRTAGRQIYYNVILLDEAGGVICEIDDFYTQTVFSKMEENVSNAYSLNWCEEKPIQLTEITPFSKFDILMFGTEETFRLVRHIFEHINVDFVTLSFTLPDKQMDEHKVLEHIKKKRYHAVVYAHLSVTSLTENHNDLIYQISKWNFLWLKDLMCILSRSSLREPLFVMTNNTQQKEENNGNTLNLCGAELWGMTRCAQQESLYPDIRLLDIDVSSFDIQTLLTIIGNSLPSEKELKMEGKSVWKSRLRQVTESHELKSQKVLPFEEGILAKLKTAHPNKIVSPFLELVEYDVKNVHLSQDSVRIRLYQSCLYDTAVFPVTSCSFNQKYLLWPRTSAEGFTPLSIEGEGLLVQEGTSIAKVPNGDRLYFCYPVNIATYVDIPSQCIFMPSEIPSYLPGLLTLSVVLFSSVSRVPKGISSTVLVHESFQCCQSFVEGFLECCCDRPVSCLYTTDIVKGTLQHEKMFNGIIVLTKLNEEITEKLLACVPTLQYIITLPVFLPLNLRHMIAMATQEITVIELRGEELFRSKHLMKIMPMIRSSLGKCHGKALCTEDLKRDGSARVENLALPSKTCPLSDNICELTPIYASAKHMFRKNSCYIVVGGLTGLGWILVTYIAENGGGHIASLSRRKPSNQQLNEMDILMNKTRCTVKAYQSDITDFHNLNNTIKCLQNDLNGIQIKGIFNGAGVLDDELLVRMTEQQVEKVFKPKVLGSLNLHLATQHLTLDFFVMQSSIVSIIGNVGQSNYGAANSFMDALVHHRRSQNLSGQTINWGPLSVGMAQQNTEIKIHLQKMGMSPLTAEDICSLFKETLTADRRQTLLGSINWSILEKQLGSAKFKDLVPLQVNSPQNEDEQGHVFDETSFQMLTEDQKDSVLFEHIVQVLCSVLPIRDTTTLVPNLQIGELGIDSFAAMSSVNKLVDLTGCRVPLQMLMSDTATVYDIVLFIRASMDKKEHNSGDVGSNDHFLETDTKLSFMEKETLLEYASSKNKDNFVMAVDIATETTELGLETWRKILRHVVLMNPELCRRFTLTSDGIAVYDVSDEDADVKVKLVTVEDMVNIDPRNRLRFSLENELPIQFQIAFDRLCTYIRVILHAGSQDLITQTFIARDIKIIASSVIQGRAMPKKKEKRDIPQILHTIVNKRYDSLKKFWSEQIGDVKQSASLSHTESIEALDSPSFKTLEFKFQDEVAERIMTFMHKHNLTLFQFFISVYQLLLYGETNSKIIPVFSSVDMRIHDERLRDAFGRCINTVPFVASFREDVSVLDFFLSNSKIAILTTEHSVYPFSMILEEIKEQKLRKHFRRHALVIDDITMIEQLKQSDEKRIDIKNVWLTTFAMKETALRIIHDTQSKMIRGEFEYNQRICSNTRGEKILSDLLSLVERCIWHQNQAISLVIKDTANHVVMNSKSLETREKVQGDSDDSINDQPKLPLGGKTPSNQVSSTVVPPNGEGYFLTRDEENPAGEPDVTIHNKTILKSGVIRKHTRQGWDHTILLRFAQIGDSDALKQPDKCYYEWTSSGNKRFRRLPLSSIMEVQCWKRLYDYPSFVILTKKRKYVMKTETLEEAEEWVEVFQSAICHPESTKL